MAVFGQPAEETTNRDQIAVDGRHGLTSVPPKMVLKSAMSLVVILDRC